MRRKNPLLVAAFLALILAGCSEKTGNSGTIDIPNAESPMTETSSPSWIEPSATASSESTPTSASKPSNTSNDNNTSTSEASPDKQAELKDIGQKVVEILRERDLRSLAEWIDPEQGLRFSPYSYINKDSDLIFKADELPTFNDTNKLLWGSEDGSGDPIELTFRDYYDKFVYKYDFADAPNVSVNKIMGLGNAEFNGTEIYPNASYIEFHFPGFDKEFDGMDWQSLVLVFVPYNEEWKLTAIVHGQWTI